MKEDTTIGWGDIGVLLMMALACAGAVWLITSAVTFAVWVSLLEDRISALENTPVVQYQILYK